MILDIEGIIAVFSGLFVFLSIINFMRYFYKDTRLAIYRIKLSRNITKYFIFFLSANFILIVMYSFAAGPQNIKYGVLGVIIYTLMFGIFFLVLSSDIKGKKLLD